MSGRIVIVCSNCNNQCFDIKMVQKSDGNLWTDDTCWKCGTKLPMVRIEEEKQFTLEEVEEALKRAKYLLEKDETNQFAGYRGDIRIAYRDLTKITQSLLKRPETLVAPIESLPSLTRAPRED